MVEEGAEDAVTLPEARVLTALLMFDCEGTSIDRVGVEIEEPVANGPW